MKRTMIPGKLIVTDNISLEGAVAGSGNMTGAGPAPSGTGPKWRGSGRAAMAVRGGAWSLIGYIATQLLRTVATLVLARHFLGPEAFGVVGLLGVFLAGLGMFSELGIMANVIQHPRGDEPLFLSTAYSIQVGRGLCIWMACLVAAYPLAVFYHLPQLFPLLSVAGLSEMVRGLASPSVWTLTRHVKLRNITLVTIASEIVASGVAILWAVISPSAWALVARTIAASVVYVAGSHFISERPLSFSWDRSAARDILRFGGWISVATAAYFLGSQGERLILGKVITAAELGCFSLALMISSVPAAGINQLSSQILLPLLSSTVRTCRPDTIRDFRRTRKLSFAVAVVAALGFLAVAKPLVALVLPPKYAMAGWMLQLLGIRVALDIFATAASSITLAYGQARYSAGANATRVILMIGGVWWGFTSFGIKGAVVSLVIAQALSYFPLIVGLKRFLPEVAGAELRWYGLFLLLLTVAAGVFGIR